MASTQREILAKSNSEAGPKLSRAWWQLPGLFLSTSDATSLQKVGAYNTRKISVRMTGSLTDPLKVSPITMTDFPAWPQTCLITMNLPDAWGWGCPWLLPILPCSLAEAVGQSPACPALPRWIPWWLPAAPDPWRAPSPNGTLRPSFLKKCAAPTHCNTAVVWSVLPHLHRPMRS